MNELLELVKIVAWVLFSLIFFFLLLVVLAKYYFNYRQKQDSKKTDFIQNVFDSHFGQEKMLQPEVVKKLKKYIPQLMVVLGEFETIHQGDSRLEAFKAQLTESVLRPAARKLASSYQWINRFYATQCYGYGFGTEDNKKIILLLRDRTLLISLNMASEVIKKQDAFLINEMITVFSEGRRLQQTSFASIVTPEHPDISSILKERLEKETNLYVKVFCYRLLSKMPRSEMTPSAQKDIESDSIDLKISTLDYLIHNGVQIDEEVFSRLITDKHWEVRASAARVLGDISGENSLKQLVSLVKDESWWVRINAANSLGRKGESGFNILKKLNPEDDKFAYETAQSILRAKEQNDG